MINDGNNTLPIYLLGQLQNRLASVQRRLNEATVARPGEAGYLYIAGQLLALRNEKVFLLSLLESIEVSA